VFFAGANPSLTSGRVAGGARVGVSDKKAIDLFDAWLFAEADASLMLSAWSSAAPEDRADAHAGYRAALDREEQAARCLAERVRPGRSSSTR
jgi:hypothetical protein